jgi:hypothetical protein
VAPQLARPKNKSSNTHYWSHDQPRPIRAKDDRKGNKYKDNEQN